MLALVELGSAWYDLVVRVRGCWWGGGMWWKNWWWRGAQPGAEVVLLRSRGRDSGCEGFVRIVKIIINALIVAKSSLDVANLSASAAGGPRRRDRSYGA